MAKIKRTHTFDEALLQRLERAAKIERRPVSVQLAIFLEQALKTFEKEQLEKKESEPGNFKPSPLGTVQYA